MDMDLPVLLTVDDDADALAAVETELLDRYARHYRVVGLTSSAEAEALLDELAAAAAEVALVLAAQWLPETTGSELLDHVGRSHPHARRALLIAWGEWGQNPTGEAIFDGVAHGWFEHYVVRPTEPPDEFFHESISSLLLDWAEDRRAAPYTVHVVGESWWGRAYELARPSSSAPSPTTSASPTPPRGRPSWPPPARASSSRSWCSRAATCW